MKIVLVNYYNTRPFLYGLQAMAEKTGWEIIEAYPAKCAELFLNGEVDVGLVPIGALAEERDKYIFSDYCIGCVGSVKSVAIYSHQPLENVSSIYLDYQSRTSNILARIIVDKLFKLDLPFIESFEGYESHQSKDRASVIIGDRTVEADCHYTYKYDLGQKWMEYSSLPFCFASWVSQEALDIDIREEFNRAFKYGIKNIDKIIRAEKDAPFDLNSYYKESIDYKFDEEKKKALSLFYQECSYESPVIL